jgi:hypothetical protein
VILLACRLKERKVINSQRGKRSGENWGLLFLCSRILIGRDSRPKRASSQYEQSFEEQPVGGIETASLYKFPRTVFIQA